MNNYFRVAPDIAIIPQHDGNILFKSDVIAIRVEGELGQTLVDQIFPLLDGLLPVDEVARQVGMEPSRLTQHLTALLRHGILRSSEQPMGNPAGLSNFLRSADAMGMDTDKLTKSLLQVGVVVAGLEGVGAQVAAMLAQLGVGRLTLLDPFPCESENVALTPYFTVDDVGCPRQEVMQRWLANRCPATTVQLGPPTLTRANVLQFAAESEVLVSTFDRDFTAAHYWINEASVELGIPAVYAEIQGHVCRIGPIVLPGQTACFMCYRMRTMATADDFDEAMGYEEFLNAQKQPNLHRRGFFPSTIPLVAGALTTEIIKLLLSAGLSTLAGKLMEVHVLDNETSKHHIVQKPGCPVCSKKKVVSRRHLSLSELRDESYLEGVLAQYRSVLISPLTGIVRRFERVQKDVTEPVAPYIFRADISNHTFLDKEHSDENVCSGKGLTVKAAEISALGEAVERYSGEWSDRLEIRYCRANELEGAVLDPAALVPFAQEQYNNLPFTPYQSDRPIGWVPGYSLVDSRPIHLPAIGVFMNYSLKTDDERLFPITSNGLAAGASLVKAVLAASLEVIERDAFIITWYNELPARRIDPFTHPDPEIRSFCRTYHRRGVALQLYQLLTDFPVSVFMAMGVQEAGINGPHVVVGLGSSVDPAQAARGALLEVGQIRPALRQRLRQSATKQRLRDLLENPQAVAELDDHDLLYASAEAFSAFNFLTERPIEPFNWQSSPQSPSEQLATIVNFQRQQKSDLIYYNLTPPDMERLGLFTARAILPGTQPIHFGTTNIRLGGNRLFDLPVKLGLRTTPSTPATLNSNPHPLA